jgi:hypothetical protein
MKKLILLATFFLINLDGAWCQSAISIYHLSDDSLKSLFVDFIEAEKAYNYYTEDCMFFLHVSCVDTSLCFIIESGPSNQTSLISDSTILWHESFGDIIVVELYNHYFYTFISNCADNKLPLTQTEKKLYTKKIPLSIVNNEASSEEETFESFMFICYHDGDYEIIQRFYRSYGKL